MKGRQSMIYRWLLLTATIIFMFGASIACGPECPEGQSKCGEVCVNLKIDRSNCGVCDTKCEDGQVCSDGKCSVSCQKGLTKCEGTCTNTKTDSKNCGECGTACKAGEVCTEGKCEIKCPSGQTACNDQCIDTDSDAKNCGACGTTCKAGEVCKSGKCSIVCGNGLTECNGACVNIKTNHGFCGACDVKCESGEVCKDGSCSISCGSEQTNCSGSCVNVKTEFEHCGACGKACKSGEACKEGKCVLNCQDGHGDCNGSCVDLQNSNKNCGTCGTACKQGEVCKAGKCGLDCPNGESVCGTSCTDLKSDTNNCGTCGTKCKAKEVCQSGKCEFYCRKGFTECSGSCVDVQNNNANCGTCGTACKTGEVCAEGKCAKPCPNGSRPCGGKCIDYSKDPKNCGTCGNVCGTGEVCLTGQCKQCSDCPNWAVKLGAFNSEKILAVTTDSKGNVYAAGTFSSLTAIGGKQWTSKGSTDIFIVKLSPGGVLLWAKHVGSTGSDSAFSMASDKSDNVYITGSFTATASFGTIKLSSAGSSDIFVTQLDSKGDFKWAKGLGGTGSDYGYGIAVDTAGNSYITGSFRSSVVMGSSTLTSKGGSDIFVAKLDNTGKVQFAGGAGSTSSSSDEGRAIAVDTTGNIYVTGRFYTSMSWGATTLSSSGSSDVFVAKLDKTGKLTWAAKAGGSSTDYSYALTLDSKGNVYVGGSISSSGADFDTTKLNSIGGTDAFVAKLDTTGKWSWAVNAGGGSTDVVRGLVIDSKDVLYAIGYFSGAGTFGTVSLSARGSDDVFLFQVDATGKIVGATNPGGTGDDTGFVIHIDGSDNLYLGGYFEKIAQFGKVELLTSGSSDAFIAKYSRPAQPFCPSTGSVCNNACIDTSADNKNCGGCGIACKTGELCGGGKCLQPRDGIYLEEFNTGAPDYAVIKNYSTKSLSTKGLWIYVNDSSSLTSADVHEELPDQTVAPGATVHLIESGGTTQTGDIQLTGSIPYISSSSFIMMLCKGKCDASKPANILDVLIAGSSSKGYLPGGVTFTPGPVSTISSDSTTSYTRKTRGGQYGSFKASDWGPAPKSRP